MTFLKCRIVYWIFCGWILDILRCRVIKYRVFRRMKFELAWQFIINKQASWFPSGASEYSSRGLVSRWVVPSNALCTECIECRKLFGGKYWFLINKLQNWRGVTMFYISDCNTIVNLRWKLRPLFIHLCFRYWTPFICALATSFQDCWRGVRLWTSGYC